MKRVHAVALTFLLVILILLLGWGSRNYLLQNKVTFLLNQREFKAADVLLSKLINNAPHDLRTQFLLTKTLTLTGNYQRAVRISESKNLGSDYPEVLYWRALSEYQIGKNKESALNARRFLLTNKHITNGAGDIAKALAGEPVLLDISDKQSRTFRLLFPVEQAIYTGMAASQHLKIGRLEAAARSFREAFMLGNRNQKMYYQACKVNALVGYVGDAQMFYDYSSNGKILSILEEFETAYKTYSIASLTLHSDDLAQGGRKIDLARALAWTANVYLRQAPEKHASKVSAVMNELVKEYPYDVVLQVRKAEMLDQMQQHNAALAVYNNLQQKFPNFTVLLRTAAVENVSEAVLSVRANKFMDELPSVTSVPLASIAVRNAVRNPDFVEWSQGGSAGATVTIEERGSYMIILVGKGNKTGDLWPLVKLYMDDEYAGVTYICRDKWDCYTVTVPLEAGTHTLKLINGDEMLIANENTANKDFSLRAVYVALTGVSDVR